MANVLWITSRLSGGEKGCIGYERVRTPSMESTEQACLRLGADAPVDAARVAKEARCTRASASNTLWGLAKVGKMLRVGRGQYQTATPGGQTGVRNPVAADGNTEKQG